MEQKKLFLVFLLAFGAIGIVALINLNSGSGATIVQRNCMCTLTMYDYYGSPIGSHQQVIRAPSAQSHTDAACDIRCDALYTNAYRGRTNVVGTAI